MKTLVSAMIVTLSLSAGIAQASDAVSRAEVLADLQLARQQGLTVDSEIGYPVDVATTSKTRAQVEQELATAKSAGMVDHGEATPQAATSPGAYKTRQQVQRELQDYKASGKPRYISA